MGVRHGSTGKRGRIEEGIPGWKSEAEPNPKMRANTD